ncbi:MAG: hypothetical protein B7X44_04425 [Halothiobacillus sp. 15-55-196]|nr:MAG: hypothetical protein B7X44_04425 [Halothiobacillus sp. 15-55-196]OZB79570.1 MAG: hypothetical protein B7X29_00210 [Halothiobacillus sp. 13-55-115]
MPRLITPVRIRPTKRLLTDAPNPFSIEHLEKPTECEAGGSPLSDCSVACSFTRSWRKPAPRLST